MKYHEIKEFSKRLRSNQTGSEEILWKRLKSRQFEGFKFLRQHPIMFDRQGNNLRFFIPDFYCPQARLVIEVDGTIHQLTEDYDLWRQKIIEKRNLTVIRFKNEELDKIEDVLIKIKEFLPASGSCQPLAPPYW
ncbi:MAG: DUF559 domain-containing protein [Bacteroidota bacterium]